MEAMGPRSEHLLKEIADLETAHARATEEAARLTQEVTGRQAKLDIARAQGLVGKVDQDQVAAFEAS